MSSKTRTPRTTTSTTGSALRSVPEPTVAAKVRTDAEDRLWEALHAAPHSSAADLSAAAKIGKSTAQKILVKWAADGSVTRTVTRVGFGEGGRRAADRWAITEVGSQDDSTPLDTRAADDADATDTAQAEPDAPEADDATVTEGDPVEQADAAVDDALDPVEPETADLVNAEPVVGATSDVDKPTEDGSDATSEKKARLAPGGLRGMVEDYLRDNPGEEFGPTAIANALGGKSSGAVSNALDKLVEVGVAVKKQDKPKRFALAPSEQEAAPA